MSYCEADNVVMIQSLSFSELCVSILSPVNLTQSWRSRGGWRGKIFYISWQLKPLNITWMDQTGEKIISWSALPKLQQTLQKHHLWSLPSEGRPAWPFLVSCNPCDHHNVFPTSPVKIPLYHEPDDLQSPSAEQIPRETKYKADDCLFLSAELLEFFHLKKNILKYLNAWIAFLVDC